MREALSIRPETAVEGGFILRDAVCDVVEARFVEYDYEGKAEVPAVCLKLRLKVQGLEDGEQPREQYYSVGNTRTRDGDPLFEASEDGCSWGAADEAPERDYAMRKNTDIYLFMAELAKAGIPKGHLETDISELEGSKVHTTMIPHPTRKRTLDDGREVPQELVVINEVKEWGWEGSGKGAGKSAGKGRDKGKAVGGGGGKSRAAARKSEPAQSDDDIDAAAMDAAELAAKDLEEPQEVETFGSTFAYGRVKDTDAGKAAVKDGGNPAFRKLRKAVVARVQEEEFLEKAAEEGVLSYDAEAGEVGPPAKE